LALARSMLQLGQPILAQGRDVTGNCYRQLGHEPIRGFDQRLLGVVLTTPLAPRPRSFAAVSHLDFFSS